jgi:hypothetical protein
MVPRRTTVEQQQVAANDVGVSEPRRSIDARKGEIRIATSLARLLSIGKVDGTMIDGEPERHGRRDIGGDGGTPVARPTEINEQVHPIDAPVAPRLTVTVPASVGAR